MIWTKTLENVIKTKKVRYLIVFHDIISEILSNEKLQVIVTIVY